MLCTTCWCKYYYNELQSLNTAKYSPYIQDMSSQLPYPDLDFHTITTTWSEKHRHPDSNSRFNIYIELQAEHIQTPLLTKRTKFHHSKKNLRLSTKIYLTTLLVRSKQSNWPKKTATQWRVLMKINLFPLLIREITKRNPHWLLRYNIGSSTVTASKLHLFVQIK